MTLPDKIAAIAAAVGGILIAFGVFSPSEAADATNWIGQIIIAVSGLWKMFNLKLRKDELLGELESTQHALSTMIERKPL